MANATIVLSSSPSDKWFLAPAKLMQIPHTPLDDKQVLFVDLACICMTVHKLILFPGQCKVHLGLLLFVYLDLVFHPLLRV